MMEAIANMAMNMNAAQFANQYAVSVTKKSMEVQEMAGQELINLLPDNPALMKGDFIDTYA